MSDSIHLLSQVYAETGLVFIERVRSAHVLCTPYSHAPVYSVLITSFEATYVGCTARSFGISWETENKQTMEHHGKGTKSWTTKDRPPPPPPPHTHTSTCMHASKHASTTERHWHAHIHACAFSDPNLPVDPTLFFRWCKHMHVASKTIPESTRIKEHRHFTTLCSTQCLMEPDESAMGAFVVKPPPPPPPSTSLTTPTLSSHQNQTLWSPCSS